jgi:hypothetical protein
MPTLRYRGSRQELMVDLARLPGILTGRLPDPGGVAKALMIAMGMVLLSRIKEAYVIKSRGGVDAMGIYWPPLAASTLAGRRKGRMSIRQMNQKLAGLSPERRALVEAHAARTSAAIDKQLAWERIDLLRRRKGKLTARDRAMLSLKRKKLTLATAFAEILRDTGRMLNSLSPEVITATGGGGDDTIMRTGPGWLEVGSNVEYFAYHNSDKPRRKNADGSDRLPRRQVLPDNVGQIPAAWIAEMGDAARKTMRTAEFWRLLLGAKVA